MPTAQLLPSVAWPSPTWQRHALAVSVALGLHTLVVLGLLSHWQSSPPAEPQVHTLTTQIISVLPPAPVAPVVAPAPVAKPVPPAPVAVPAPVVSNPVVKPAPAKLEEAALAHKRVEQQRVQEPRHRQEQQHLQEQQREQQHAAEKLAQQQALQRQQVADAAARAAEAQAAASRQYLPISKEAPEYPDKALEKGIEGDCTVTYTVTPQGRVDNPQVLGSCHPLLVRPSLAAARTFRYQPRIVEGQAVSVANVKNTFHYRIQ